MHLHAIFALCQAGCGEGKRFEVAAVVIHGCRVVQRMQMCYSAVRGCLTCACEARIAASHACGPDALPGSVYPVTEGYEIHKATSKDWHWSETCLQHQLQGGEVPHPIDDIGRLCKEESTSR